MIKQFFSGTLILSMLCPAVYAQSKILTTYDQLLSALQEGNNVRAIIHLDKCQPKKIKIMEGDPLPDVSGAFTRIDFIQFSYYKVLTDQGRERYTAAASYSTMTEHRHYGLTRGYARIRVFDDNTGDFHAAHYDAKTLKLKGEVNYTPHQRTLRKARMQVQLMVQTGFSTRRIRSYLHRFILWWMNATRIWSYAAGLLLRDIKKSHNAVVYD
jgi:hypothetical protein